jgi:uncharacterized protein
MTGTPSFFEIGAPDAKRAREFYLSLFDWKFHRTEGEMGWIEVQPPAAAIRGGVHGDDPDTGIELYFGVPDIDAAVRRVRELGGEAPDPEPEAEGFGRFVRCRDDQGVRFGLHQAPRE